MLKMQTGGPSGDADPVRSEDCRGVDCAEACWLLNIQSLVVLQESYPVGSANPADKFC